MTEIPENTIETPDEPKEDDKEYSGRKIMCYVSKRMVPLEDTVEVEYSGGKKYRVLPQYIKE